MKKTSLTTAVIAAIAGVAGISNVANAVYLNTDGLGQVLIYPYYTVNGGNSTVVTVVNTTANAKAVKVRFLESYDSREVLDFNLYLSKFDLWAAQVVPVGNGAGVFSNDNSCTVPALPKTAATAQPFSTYAFDGTVTGTDGGPTGVSRTLEGYIELIEMGTLVGPSAASATHSAGVPKSCGTLVSAFLPGGYWNNGGTSITTDITAASGGLFGSGTIVNVNNGTVEGYNADAIGQFYAPTDLSSHHSLPGDLFPTLTSGSSFTSYVFAPGPVGTTPVLATSTYTFSVDAVSSLFMSQQVFNEYWTGSGIKLDSEWVLTFPTKRFYVDPIFTGGVVAKPFDVLFSAKDPLNGNAPGSCAPIGISIFDREEGVPGGGSVGFSPSPSPKGPALCYEAQVVTFNGKSPSAVLGSSLARNINTGAGFSNGWAKIDLYSASKVNHVLASTGLNTFQGLPATGFWVAQFVNGNVGGVLSNYTSLYRHKVARFCSAGAANCS